LRVKVLITGSAGKIGQVLVRGLTHEVSEFDLPACDARSLDQLTSVASGHDALVHLAWKTKSENFSNEKIDFENLLMAFNAYRAAEQVGVPRVVVASSVHADRVASPRRRLLNASAISTPDSPYGASKLFVEALGRYFADRGLDVVAVRFGGVDEHASDGDHDHARTAHRWWLSHTDCIGLVNACLVAPRVPGRYTAFYGVSNNRGRIHDTRNPFGWKPARLSQSGPIARLWHRVVPRHGA
jgi:uronate dehydrogenase